MIKSKIHVEFIETPDMRMTLSKSMPQLSNSYFKGYLYYLFTLFKYLGQFPFDLVQIKTNLLYIMYSVLYQTLLIGCFIWYNWFGNQSSVKTKGSEVENFVKNTITLQLYVGLVFYFCNLLYKNKELVDVIKNLEDSNQWLSDETDYYFSYKLFFITKISLLSVIITLAIVRERMHVIPERVVWVYIGFYIQQFTGLLQPIRWKLNCLIDQLNANKKKNLSRISDQYNLIRKCCQRLNECYSVQLILFSLCLFSELVVQAYNCAKYAMNYLSHDDKGVWGLVGSILPLVMYTIDMIHIAHECSVVSSKSIELNNNLYHKMIEDQMNSISVNEKLRLHISTKREIVFTACGFFPLDYTLAHSMVAATTTYVVILIQLGPQE